MVKLPNGLSEIHSVFGIPDYQIDENGLVQVGPFWKSKMTIIRVPFEMKLDWNPSFTSSEIICHKFVANDLLDIFEEISNKVGLSSSVESYGGCFVPRMGRYERKKLSIHTWGIAVDLNGCANEYGKYGNMSKFVVDIFEEHNWKWGGLLDPPDGSHFQYADGYFVD